MSATLQSGIERIEAALQVLYEEGLKFYKPEYQASADRWAAIGHAITVSTNNARNVLQMAHAFLEWFNFHDLCAGIEFIHPLYGQTFNEEDLKRFARLFNKQGLTINTEWMSQAGGYLTKKVNVRLVIEEVTETNDEDDE